MSDVDPLENTGQPPAPTPILSAQVASAGVPSVQVPSVQVVVLNWNAADLTSRSIRSIEATDWPSDDLDLVIVDNGSIDGSAQVLARRHPNWTMIRNRSNLGFAEGINRALRINDSPMVALVNNDAVVQPGWLAPLVETLAADPNAGAAAPLVVFDRWFVEVVIEVHGSGDRARVMNVLADGHDRWPQVLCGEGVARPPHPSVPLRLEIEVAERATIAVPVPGRRAAAAPVALDVTLHTDRPVTLHCGSATITGEPTDGVVRLRLPAAAEPHRRINSLGTSLTEWCEGIERNLGDPVEEAHDAELVDGFSGGAVLLRSAALAEVGLFDPRFFMYYEDTDLAWRLRRAGWSTRTAPRSVLYHQLGATAGSSWSGFFFLNYRNWLLTVARNGDATDVRRALGAVKANSWPFVRRNVVGKVRRFQRPDLDIASRWVNVVAGTKAALPRTLTSRFGGRWRRIGNQPTESVGSRFLRRSVPLPPTPVPDGPTVVFVDVTDTLVSRWRAGIQRAVSELITRLVLQHPELSVVLIRWSELDGAYRRLDGTETEAFFDPDAMPNHTPPPVALNPHVWRRAITSVAAIPAVRSRIDQARRRRALRARPPEHGDLVVERFPAGSIMFDLDATWNLGGAPRSSLYPRLADQGVTVVSLLHDVLPVTHPDWFDPNLARVFAEHVSATIAHADVLVTSSQFSADELRGLAKSAGRNGLPIEVIPLGADPVARSPQPADRALLDPLAEADSLASRPVMLVVGTLEPRKNHAGLLDAFDLLGTPATLVIVGRQGWKADALGDRIRNHPGFGDQIVWPAEVNDATLEALYALSTVVAVPSHAEGYGLPVVEALRHGCRVVSSMGGSLREVGGADVTFVDTTDAGAFAAALDAALTDTALTDPDHIDTGRPDGDLGLPTWDASASALASILVRAGRSVGES